MLLSVRLIRKPRRIRYCDECNKLIRGKTIRFYGASDTGDKPHALFMHPECVYVKSDDRVLAALAAAKDGE